MISQDFKKFKLPDSPGVYFFKKNKRIIYIGKATSLKDRVKSYFSKDLVRSRGPLLVKMIEEADKLDYEKTDSVLEALILEARYIKKHQPYYNSREKDDKSYNFVVVTDEKYPRVLVMRGRELEKAILEIHHSPFIIRSTFGPFPNGGQLKEALRIIRKIFPFRDKCTPFDPCFKSKNRTTKALPKPCFNRQIRLCPGVCTGEISEKEYKKTINNINLFFQGKKKQIIKNLKKEMAGAAKVYEFEVASMLKSQIFALEHIRDVSLIKSEVLRAGNLNGGSGFRIEAYDIAHISGSNTVGAMAVVENGEIAKGEYRKFKILSSTKGGINDIASLKEVLVRRLGHLEWKLPNLIVVDGAMAQYNIAKNILKERGFNIELIAVVKDQKHKPSEIMGKKGIIKKHEVEILLANSEAHRFALNFHRALRHKKMFGRNL
ncbi:MAG: hypothetical protein CO184_00930 [Candidatus Zambryskibacteria bacterium CG_4_9_14_3_um_filter_40_16]|uniref:Excinuclease ABC subunit C n=2 Tax=Candidatus Zambryskiibacteriota TaxID=1817925 RepID=A0A2M7WUR0_9BACT|nr:MAG: hypothetical protein CO184_00930 [Candidatus Zambryskibacteria bacterium CG_4_9_14_3_um_filter_40_16]